MTGPVDSGEAGLKAAHREIGLAGRLARAFLDSKLTPLLVLASLGLGIFAVAVTPREEEPQIQVPMIDVIVPFPGGSAREVEERIAVPLERLLWEIPGVEYIYTTSSADVGMAIVRFRVGQDPEESLVKLYTKMMAHPETLPPGAGPPVVKPKSIDDVPILSVTLWGGTGDSYGLRRIASEAAIEIQKIPNVSEIRLIGGEPRQVRVILDPERLRGLSTSALQVAQAIEQANAKLPAGSFSESDREIAVQTLGTLRNAEDVRQVVVGVRDGRPLRLGEVAEVRDGPAERRDAVFFGAGPRGEEKGIEGDPVDEIAVTFAISKKKGANAVVLAGAIEKKLEELRRTTIPSDVGVTVTRDYGETAREKANELISHVLIATVAVVGLILLALGRREAAVVAVAVPVTLALTLAMSTVFGYTLNRVTLFALVFSIGILVDDAIVVVENIHRHFRLGWTTRKRAAIFATDEVGNPTILATLTVIAALLPLAFVSGLMGPYMRPIPVNASAAMFFSLLVAFLVTPYVTIRVLKKRGEGAAPAGADREEGRLDGRIARLYIATMRPLLASRRLRLAALGGVVILLLASVGLLFTRSVTVKMLPYDNKSEFQVVVDMPEGTTLERTAAVARSLATRLRALPEVTDYQVYVGTAAPMNFNGLVRHYDLRRGPNVADIQVNLAGKHHRKRQSHEIAKQAREILGPIASSWGARIKVAEVPPGPPVLSTMVAEVYGPDLDAQRALASEVREIFETTPGIVDVDWYVEDPQGRLDLHVDATKAALSGITPAMIARELAIGGGGAEVGLLHVETDRERVGIVLAMDRPARRDLAEVRDLVLNAPDGRMVPLAELIDVIPATTEPSIYHKNLRRVTYVTGEVAGAQESPIYGILNMKERIAGLRSPDGGPVAQLYSAQPESEEGFSVKWDGEWQITYEVFRDMGIAFAVVMLLVYVLVVAWFKSFLIPFVIMAPIPLTLIGILPGHWATGLFFTATSMIGFIALAGIIVRNSILLVDFINLELEAGASPQEAVLKAGAVRFRPIVLTAAALVVGGLVIVLDPIFQGLAVSLMFGVVVSTALTLIVIPLLYSMYLNAVGPKRSLHAEGEKGGADAAA